MRRSTATIVLLLALSVIPATGWTQTPDDLFNGQVLQRVDLLLHSADWEKLKANFLENTYYPADLTWNGVRRCATSASGRAGHGSRSGNKPGLRVDFDRYSTDQEFLGLKSLVLDNLTQDSSGIHETVTMALFARLGIPAPREAHARLYVNNEYAGLYVIVEAVDKRLLARVFGVIDEDTQNDGFLFEFNWEDEWRLEHLGDDLRPYKERFDAKTHESKSDEEKYRPIEELVRLVNDTPRGSAGRNHRPPARPAGVHPLRRRAELRRRDRRRPRHLGRQQLLSLSPREPHPARLHRLGR